MFKNGLPVLRGGVPLIGDENCDCSCGASFVCPNCTNTPSGYLATMPALELWSHVEDQPGNVIALIQEAEAGQYVCDRFFVQSLIASPSLTQCHWFGPATLFCPGSGTEAGSIWWRPVVTVTPIPSTADFFFTAMWQDFNQDQEDYIDSLAEGDAIDVGEWYPHNMDAPHSRWDKGTDWADCDDLDETEAGAASTWFSNLESLVDECGPGSGGDFFKLIEVAGTYALEPL
jgi:hypothetical protein